MEWFLLNHNSAGRLSPVIVSFLIIVFLMMRKNRNETFRWFTYYFIFVFIVQFGFFTAYTVYHPAGAAGWLLTSLAPFGLACLIQFAYRFPSPLAVKESKIVLIVSLFAAVCSTGDYLYHYYIGTIVWKDFSYGPEYVSSLLFFIVAVMYVWSIVVFFRQAAAISVLQGDTRPLIKRIMRPSSRQAQSAQRFGCIVFFECALSVFMLIWSVSAFVSPDTLTLIENTGFLILYLSYVIIFINSSSQNSSLLIKLMSTSLIVALTVLTAAGQLASGWMDAAVHERYRDIAERTVENAGTNVIVTRRDIEFVLHKTAGDASRFSASYVKDEKFDINKFYETYTDTSIATYRDADIDADISQKRTAQYSIVHGRDIVYFYYTVYKDGQVFCVGFDYRLYRQYFHQLMKLFVVLYIITVMIISLLYPLLFRYNLMRPIRELVNGARIVKDGNLDIKLTVRCDDEIGFLTVAFNEMIDTLKSSKQHQEHYSLQLENAFVKIETSKNDLEDNLLELRRTHNALQESQQRYRDLNAELELRVADRTSRLEEANAELVEALEQLKLTQAELIQNEKLASLGDMVAGIAHEINTPVGVAITASSYLERNVRMLQSLYKDSKLTKTDLERYLSACEESAVIIFTNLHRAGELIQSFKLVAADQASEEKRSFSLCQYIEDILNSLHPKLKKTTHRVELNCRSDISVYSYPGAFSQIITNFVMNSLIHAFNGKENGIMTIDISADDEFLELVYRDDGCGIDDAHISKIFAPFFTTRRHSGGTGLGLHIVYNLVTQKLGGSIDAQSESGKGVTFIIRIPMQQMIIPERII